MIDWHTESSVLWQGPGERKNWAKGALITLFRGKEVLPCVSLYMQELCSHKHTHVRKECSLLCSFGSGISYSNRKVIKRKPRGECLTCLYSTLRIIIYGVIYVFRDFPVAPGFFFSSPVLATLFSSSETSLRFLPNANSSTAWSWRLLEKKK